MWQINTIKKYKNNSENFIETGTWMGDGVQVALDLGFKNVYTCDIDEANVKNAKEKYKNKSVECIHDSSEMFLKNICPKLKNQSVIWLDAHVMPDATGIAFASRQLEFCKKFNVTVCPIIQELENIFNYSTCFHTILIDDYHCFGNWEFSNLTADETVKFILSKNKNYNFNVEENVLCCYLENNT